MMGFWEKTGEVVGAVAGYYAKEAERHSKNKVFNEEQQEYYRTLSDNLRKVSDTFSSNSDEDNY